MLGMLNNRRLLDGGPKGDVLANKEDSTLSLPVRNRVLMRLYEVRASGVGLLGEGVRYHN